MKISVKLGGHKAQVYPKCRIHINKDCVFDGTIEGEQHFDFTVDKLLEDNLFIIEHYEKNEKHTTETTDTAIELLGLSFNDTPVLDTVLYDKPYFVNWSRWWPGDRPPFVKGTLYFGWNGEYRFDFSDRVQADYYKQFWLDEAQAHINQTSNEFYRDGEFVEIDRGIDATIFDLERIILKG